MTNDSNLAQALDFIRSVIVGRLRLQLSQAEEVEVSLPQFYQNESPFAQFIQNHNLDFDEYTILMLALTPYVKPNLFNQIIAGVIPEGSDLPEFGGVKGNSHRGILPTGETAQFILAGDDLEKRFHVQHILSSDHWFAKKHILWLETVHDGEPVMSGRLMIDPDTVEFLTTGKISKPRFSNNFPAEYIETEMEWNDLVLHNSTRKQISEIENWINHNETLMNNTTIRKRVKPGYRVLFYGPPGTGKTLAATLLGKQTGKDVFRIDLSRVISKYIGETEKNLSGLFDRAEDKNWILFFDEADALFGKRTDIRDAHDKYANQEVAYLLQRIESFNGVVILATNQRGNIDDAFIRRFQAIIHFPMPGISERASIWEKTLPENIEKSKEIDWHQIASKYELSGAGIVNVTHFCALECAAENTKTLSLRRLENAILREYIKEGRVV